MSKATQAEMDHAPDEDQASRGGVTSGTAFQAVVALWFAALFGGGCLFLPPVLFDMIFAGHAPFGPQTRIVVAIAAAGIGLLMGLFIASKVRSDKPNADNGDVAAAPKPRRKRKRDARPPLDVRAALGLDRDDDEDDDNGAMELSTSGTADAFDLDDEFKAPIDDPHFASAWSDSDAYEPIPQDGDENAANELAGQEPAAPMPDTAHLPAHEWQDAPPPATRQAAPSRYNPFADFAKDDDEIEETAAPDRPTFDTPRAPLATESAAPTPSPTPFHEPAPRVNEPEPFTPPAPPPPPAWPQPRNEEPALGELGVAELVERLARALQGQDAGPATAHRSEHATSQSTGFHHSEAAREPVARTAPTAVAQNDIDRALRGALDRLSRLDDVA